MMLLWVANISSIKIYVVSGYQWQICRTGNGNFRDSNLWTAWWEFLQRSWGLLEHIDLITAQNFSAPLSFPMIYSITLQFTYHCPPKYKLYLVFRSSEFQFTFPFPLSLYSISLISGFNTRIFIDILF